MSVAENPWGEDYERKPAIFTNCHFFNNTAEFGGAIETFHSPTTIIRGSVFRHNAALVDVRMCCHAPHSRDSLT